MFDIDLIEGEDHPGEFPPEKYYNIGNKVGLLLRICPHLHSTGKVVIIDIGLCVL